MAGLAPEMVASIAAATACLKHLESLAAETARVTGKLPGNFWYVNVIAVLSMEMYDAL